MSQISETDLLATLDTVKAVAKDTVQTRRELDTLARDQAEMRALMKDGWSKSTGAAGVTRRGLEQLGELVKTVVGLKTGTIQKVAADLVIGTSDRGGYLVPVQIQPTVDALLRPEGSFLAACNFTSVEPGVTYRFPSFSNAPAAAWALTEGASLGEYDVQIGALERSPKWCGGYNDISHQLFYQSAHSVGSTIAAEAINAIRQKVEASIIVGDDSGTDPWDGLTVMGSTQSQNALATPTVALMSGFIGESLVDVPSLWEAGHLIMSPAVAEIIREDSCSTAYTSRVTFGPNGTMYFDKWPVHVTPAIGNGYVVMCDPRLVHVVNHGTTIIVDDKSQVKNLLVTLAVGGWYGYGVSLPGSVSKAVITALA